MVCEAGDWKHGFQLPASEMIDMKARPGASFNPNPERRGGSLAAEKVLLSGPQAE